MSTNVIKTNDGDELSGKLFADELLKNGECQINILAQFKNIELARRQAVPTQNEKITCT